MTLYTTLTLNITHYIAYVSLNRPDVRNAFNETLITELSSVFNALRTEKAVRGVVLQAVGKAFCAGADLNWMQKMASYSHAENVADASALATMLRTIYECPKPVIVKIQGDVFAGGIGLVAACDIAVTAPTARFCLSEVKLGLIPATIAPYVIRAMGARQAHRYFLTAEIFDAQEAQRIGLVHEVAMHAEDLDAKVKALTDNLLAASPAALAECKRLLHDVSHAPINDALVKDTAERIANVRASDEGKAGVAAFLHKETPAWVVTPQPTSVKV
jgi:methylglutaconyl-CoA hydratase